MATARVRLNRTAVLAAAVRLADREGAEALTVRRLADDLGVHPTSLYNHVPSKEAILDGVVELLFQEVELTGVHDWRDWVRELAFALRALARAHPGAFMVLTRRPAETPEAYAIADLGVRAFRADGRPLTDAVHAVRVVSLALLGIALNECPPMGDWVEPMSGDPDLEAFPMLAEAADAVRADDDSHWPLAVEVLVAGLVR